MQMGLHRGDFLRSKKENVIANQCALLNRNDVRYLGAAQQHRLQFES